MTEDAPVNDSCFMRERARASCTPSTTAFHASVVQQYIIHIHYMEQTANCMSKGDKRFSCLVIIACHPNVLTALGLTHDLPGY